MFFVFHFKNKNFLTYSMNSVSDHLIISDPVLPILTFSYHYAALLSIKSLLYSWIFIEFISRIYS